MHNSFLKKAIALNQSREAYATATIVRRKIPSSGKPGDKAIITKEGHIHGWIGGGCTRGIVLKEALLAIQERKPRMVAITPNVNNNFSDNTKTYSMTCQSGGEVEVYIEPVLPKPHIVVFGSSHIGMALCRVAKSMDYQVDVVMAKADVNVYPEADSVLSLGDVSESLIQGNSFVVVCTQGEGDADAMFKALSFDVQYISFVASLKKANAIFSDLRGMKVPMDKLKMIKTPAGIDIGAKLPEEVAISILAQIIKELRVVSQEKKVETSNNGMPQVELKNEDFYMNPVCNIPVQKSTAKHVLEHNNQKVYFCCDGCKVSFEKSPETYLPVV